MTDDTPNYSRNIVQRRQVVPVVGFIFFFTTLFFFLMGIRDDAVQTADGPVVTLHWHAVEVVRVPVPNDTFPARTAAVGWQRLLLGFAFAVVSSLVGVGGGYAFFRLHRSVWPEEPDGE